MRILVVDDFEPFRRFICSRLEQESEFRVIGQSADGLDAVRKAEELQPDLILLDIGLRSLNGLEAARRIRTVAPRAKILCLSQEFSLDLIEAAFRAGAMGYVHKLRAGSELMPGIQAVSRDMYFVSGAVKGQTYSSPEKPPAHHEVQFYSNEGVLLESFTDFIADTLKVGRAAILLVSEPHRAAVLQRLTARRLDVRHAIQSGVLIPVDAAETFSKFKGDAMPDPDRFFDVADNLIERATRAATRERPPRVAVCREFPPPLLEKDAATQALRLEQLWDLVVHRSALDLICGYAMAGVEKDSDVFHDICAAHSAIHSR